jgi:hypothetical protein
MSGIGMEVATVACANMEAIDFIGFAGDCTITGQMTMFGDRLTDFLNGQERFHLHQVEFESLEDGHRLTVDGLSIAREDLLAVVATGPRGSEHQRVSLKTDRCHVSVGPYLILGRLHTERGLDPIASVEGREPMVPLTGATIAYEVAGTIVARDVGAIIVNRLLVDWISPTVDAETVFPDAPVRAPYSSRLPPYVSGISVP